MKDAKKMYVLSVLALVASFILLAVLEGPADLSGFVIRDVRIVDTFNYSPGDPPTADEALDLLLQAESDHQEMQNFNLSTLLIRDTLLEAKRSYVGNSTGWLLKRIRKEQDYDKIEYMYSLIDVYNSTPDHEIKQRNLSEVRRLVQLIRFRKEYAYSLLDYLTLVREKMGQYEKEGINTSGAPELIRKAEESLSKERYDEARSYLEEADNLLDQAKEEHSRLQEALRETTAFVVRYWWQILIVLGIIAAVTPIIVRKIRIKLLQRKIQNLEDEQKLIEKLIVKLQDDYIRSRIIPKQTYEIRMERYRKRITEIKEMLPVMKSNLSDLMKDRKKKRKKNQEKGSGKKGKGKRQK
ncbi:hypothetical protein GF351_00845 [Candidatus Woesearchaeota archaeon]|nr:hypothetical protein [Candidatus Woesearchaeota archaeon]